MNLRMSSKQNDRWFYDNKVHKYATLVLIPPLPTLHPCNQKKKGKEKEGKQEKKEKGKDKLREKKKEK